MRCPIALLAVAWLAAAPARADEGAGPPSYATVDEVLAEFADEPTVAQVQAWATDFARLGPAEADQWLRQSRTFALLPEVQIEARLRDGWDQGFQYQAADGHLDHPDDDVFDVLDDAGRDQDRTVVVRATWELDRLVLSPERIRVLDEVQDLADLRESVLEEVTGLYFERRGLQVDALLDPPADLSARTTAALRIDEITARLDALTGGAFSRGLP